jgi:trk system potassium uptake protein TrkA
VAWTTDQVLRRLLPAETRSDWVDPTGHVGLIERPIPPKAVGKKLALLNRPGRFWLTAVTRFGKAQIVTTDLVGQEGDVLVFVADIEATDELQAHIEAGGEV